MAKIMVSAGISSTSFSSNVGLKRRLASKTAVQRTVRRPVTVPFCPRTSLDRASCEV